MAECYDINVTKIINLHILAAVWCMRAWKSQECFAMSELLDVCMRKSDGVSEWNEE